MILCKTCRGTGFVKVTRRGGDGPELGRPTRRRDGQTRTRAAKSIVPVFAAAREYLNTLSAASPFVSRDANRPRRRRRHTSRIATYASSGRLSENVSPFLTVMLHEGLLHLCDGVVRHLLRTRPFACPRASRRCARPSPPPPGSSLAWSRGRTSGSRSASRSAAACSPSHSSMSVADPSAAPTVTSRPVSCTLNDVRGVPSVTFTLSVGSSCL